MGPVGAVPVSALFVGGVQSGGSSSADGVAAAFVFVVGGDVADRFVESDARGRHPDPVLVGASVGELAMGAVDVGPLLEHRNDLGLFPVEQAMDRVTSRRCIVERKTVLAAGVPPPGPLTV